MYIEKKVTYSCFGKTFGTKRECNVYALRNRLAEEIAALLHIEPTTAWLLLDCPDYQVRYAPKKRKADAA